MPQMVIDERIHETANITGTGEYMLGGAATGKQPLSVIGANNYAPLFITDDINWEAGLYTYVSGPGRAQRTHVVKSSNGGAAVNWNNANVKIKCGWPAWLTDHRQVSKSVAGSSNVTLTALEQRCRQLVLTGALTGNINVIVDDTKWGWDIHNNTSGAFTLTIKTASGSGVAVAQGKRARLLCDGTDVVPGLSDLSALGGVDAAYVAAQVLAASGPGIKQGLALSNNTTDAPNDLDIAAGKAVDTTGAVVMSLGSAITKKLDDNWAPGTNQGGRYSGAAIANTTYHAWLVAKAGGADVDVYLAPSAVAATVLGWLQAETGGGSYLYLWRIGSIIRASAAIRQFRQFRDQFLWDNLGALDLNATSSTSAALVTLSVPSGRKVRALMNVFDTNATAGTQWYLSDPDVSDIAPSITAWPLGSAGAPINGAAGRTQVQVTTNTSAQIRHRNTRSDSTLRIATMGWIDSEIYGA